MVKVKQYLLEKDTNVGTKTLYVCKHCREILNANNIPGWCVFKELSNLNALECQFIQRPKCFQTVNCKA